MALLSKSLKNGTDPSEGEFFLANPAAKYYILNSACFKIQDGIWKTGGNSQDAIVVPRARQTEVMRGSHDIPAAGHQGRDRTMAKLKEKYFWYHLTSDIEKYVASCSVCSLSKKDSLPGRSDMNMFHA